MSTFKYIKYMCIKGCVNLFGVNSKKKGHKISREAIERMQKREYGRKINDYTRLKKKY